MLDKIQDIVKRSIDEIMQTQNEENKGKYYQQKDSVLFGSNGLLDSISLVSLILAVEEKVQEELGIDLLLANEKAMSQKSSPFRNYETLTHYVYDLVRST